jgi:hypothetical protein
VVGGTLVLHKFNIRLQNKSVLNRADVMTREEENRKD